MVTKCLTFFDTAVWKRQRIHRNVTEFCYWENAVYHTVILTTFGILHVQKNFDLHITLHVLSLQGIWLIEEISKPLLVRNSFDWTLHKYSRQAHIMITSCSLIVTRHYIIWHQLYHFHKTKHQLLPLNI